MLHSSLDAPAGSDLTKDIVAPPAVLGLNRLFKPTSSDVT
jgi:hypothetical protein